MKKYNTVLELGGVQMDMLDLPMIIELITSPEIMEEHMDKLKHHFQADDKIAFLHTQRNGSKIYPNGNIGDQPCHFIVAEIYFNDPEHYYYLLQEIERKDFLHQTVYLSLKASENTAYLFFYFENGFMPDGYEVYARTIEYRIDSVFHSYFYAASYNLRRTRELYSTVIEWGRRDKHEWYYHETLGKVGEIGLSRILRPYESIPLMLVDRSEIHFPENIYPMLPNPQVKRDKGFTHSLPASISDIAMEWQNRPIEYLISGLVICRVLTHKIRSLGGYFPSSKGKWKFTKILNNRITHIAPRTLFRLVYKDSLLIDPRNWGISGSPVKAVGRYLHDSFNDLLSSGKVKLWHNAFPWEMLDYPIRIHITKLQDAISKIESASVDWDSLIAEFDAKNLTEEKWNEKFIQFYSISFIADPEINDHVFRYKEFEYRGNIVRLFANDLAFMYFVLYKLDLLGMRANVRGFDDIIRLVLCNLRSLKMELNYYSNYLHATEKILHKKIRVI